MSLPREERRRRQIIVCVTHFVVWAVLLAEHVGAGQPLLLPPDRAGKLPRGAPWKARGLGGGGDHDTMTLADGVKMMGTTRATWPLRGVEVRRSFVEQHGNSSSLPHAYDVRDAWWRCSAVSRVLNQGPCGSCYAVN